MIDPKQFAEFEQGFSLISELTPMSLKSFYAKCLHEGFTESQAFQLIRDMLFITMRPDLPPPDISK